MSNDGFNIKGNFSWKHFDSDGNLLDMGITPNRVCDTLRDCVIEGIYAGSMPYPVSMAIGTGTGQAVTDNTLSSLSSYENSSGTNWTISQPSAAKYQCVSTFTATGTWAITEAGMFTAATSLSSMCVYDDSITVNMTSGDTLQGTWTIQTYS